MTLRSVLSLRCITLTSILISPSPAQRYMIDHWLTESFFLSDPNTLSFIPVFCLERTIEPEPGLAWQASKTWFNGQISLYFLLFVCINTWNLSFRAGHQRSGQSLGGQSLFVHSEGAAFASWSGGRRHRRRAVQLRLHQWDSFLFRPLWSAGTYQTWAFFMFSPVKVEMKGPHDYSSPADWPLMMVCTINDVKRVFLLWYYAFSVYCVWINDAVFASKQTGWLSGPALVSVAVLHGHVHRVRALWGSLALLVRLLLERPVEDPILDRRRHHTGHAGKGCVLLGIPEHPLQRRLRLVEVRVRFFLSPLLLCQMSILIARQQFRVLWYLPSCSPRLKDPSPESSFSSSVLDTE